MGKIVHLLFLQSDMKYNVSVPDSDYIVEHIYVFLTFDNAGDRDVVLFFKPRWPG